MFFLIQVSRYSSNSDFRVEDYQDLRLAMLHMLDLAFTGIAGVSFPACFTRNGTEEISPLCMKQNLLAAFSPIFMMTDANWYNEGAPTMARVQENSVLG